MPTIPTRTGTSGEAVFLSEGTVWGAVVASMNGVGDGHGEESRTDLDSHANMPVTGSGVHVLADHNRTCEVSPYSPDYEPMEVPLVDAVKKNLGLLKVASATSTRLVTSEPAWLTK
jgi:hypothetical protein